MISTPNLSHFETVEERRRFYEIRRTPGFRRIFRWSGDHYNDAIMTTIASQITSLTVITQPFIQTQIKENIKASASSQKCLLNGNVWISTKILLKFVPKDPINNNPALFQIMVWRRTGDKPLSEPVMESLLTHICVTRPQWVNWPKA